jgi:hypothetical protein
MKNIKSVLLILLPVLALSVWSFSSLHRSPVSIFVLKGAGKSSEAFQLHLYLDRRDPSIEAVRLTSSQKSEGAEILKKNDLEGLEVFSKTFGKYPAVMGLPDSGEGWPGYLGGGLTAFFHDSLPVFDNLRWTDRFYFALKTRIPPPAPFSVSEIPMIVSAETHSNVKGSKSQPFPSPGPSGTSKVLRVEIQNGCGITGAADWVARRLKGSGIQITETGNADHFHYVKTAVKSSAGLPVALEEAVERMGVSRESVEEVSSFSGMALLSPGQSLPPDVIVIIGKDFKKLKERARERAH